MEKASKLAAAVLVVLYPFLVYSGWQRFSPRWLLGGALVIFGLRLLIAGRGIERAHWKALALPWLLPGVLLLIAFAVGRREFILYWPALISLALLTSFGWTLVQPPTMVERFARLRHPQLTEMQIAYCRKVTQVWCLFFIANGLVALTLALGNSLKAWTLYNGLISYLLIGALAVSEYVYRHWRFRPENDRLTEWMNRWSH